MDTFHATTVCAVRKGDTVALGADGQVTLGNTIMKSTASKIRRLADGRVLAGFAGSVSDAISLFERFEGKLSQFSSNLSRAAVELGKEWRTDKYLRNLDALLAVCDKAVPPDCRQRRSHRADTASSPSGRGPLRAGTARALMHHTPDGRDIVRVSSSPRASASPTPHPRQTL